MAKSKIIHFAGCSLFSFSFLIGPSGFAQKKDLDAQKPTLTKRIVFLGDSITEGYGVETSQAFPIVIRDLFKAKGRAIDVTNAGISGSTSASGPSRVRWQLKTKPDLMLIELGANDGLRGQNVESIQKNLREMIKLCKSAGVKVILVAMQLPPNYGETYRKEFEKVFVSVAKSEKIQILPFLDEFFQKKNLMQADGLHPNADGHRYIAQKLLPVLESNL